MAALTDLSDVINRATGGAGAAQNQWWFKVARIAGAAAPATIAGRPATLWRYDGQPAGGATPGAVEIPTNATVGALPFTSPGGGRESWLIQAWASGLNAGTVILYDRLMHIGGLSGASAVAQTVQGDPASPAISRNTGGVGNFAFIEIHTAIGSSATTVTGSYRDQDGNLATTVAQAIGGTNNNEATRVIFLPLAAGDTGVRSVNTITLAASTTTAGNIGVVIGKPLAYLPIGGAGGAAWRDFVTGLPGVPDIESGACLSLLWIPNGTAAPELFGGYGIVEA